ncbi:uncharacterized protein LOC115926148 [Strongylocentrotus purpuratus]|uniref:Uncharacterized protein n=2 Tax=Strongylocentrotus purpuratus TaxID=7668 RepID=A0A7M7P7E0_STRPU|nr:uncharacterized protein LOC115920957 [Strongylocentrotus purpuratus]XP_030844316.1 uncharacterized protein LOC115925145 [Strongylocentrotus purpuratus]XP_030846521.1 uncharacterized protein LOC115926146 [Strongylocentrotus purpuratus]XP_030846525.1 uncharacterized protein LOC115926148 [Strongylocentrotus purpuratus]
MPVDHSVPNTSPAHASASVQSAKVSSSSCSINVMTTSNNNCRKWDKPQYCKFCSQPQKKLPRHLLTPQHVNETEVQQWIATKDMKEKANLLAKMRNYGNYRHNVKVLQENKGTLIVAYRPKYDVDPEEYLPCSHCYAFYSKDDLYRHVHRCKLRPDVEDEDETCEPPKKKKRTLHVQTGRMMLPGPSGVSPKVHMILSMGVDDEILRVVKSDRLMQQVAERLTLKHGHDKDQYSYIRQKLRELARLVREYRKLNDHPSASLVDLICPTKFNEVIAATRKAAGFNEDTHLYTTPSLALKVGYTLVTAAKVLMGNALLQADAGLEKKCKQFIKSYTLKWEAEVSTHALRTLKVNKRNTSRLLPLTTDVVALSNYVRKETKEGKQKLNSCSSDETLDRWKQLAEVTLTQVCVFNRKRPGEVSKMPLSDYKCITKGEGGIFGEGLTKWEKALCNVVWRVEINGKCNNTVPVLLTDDMKGSIDLLMEKRSQVVNDGNPYLFANPDGRGHLRATDTVRNHAQKCGAKYPDQLRLTKLRKHIAISSQIMNLKDNEVDILATFMGHDIRTHRAYYRLPDASLQVAKISKVLFSMEKGDLKAMAGKTLDDVRVDADEECNIDPDVDDDPDNEVNRPDDAVLMDEMSDKENEGMSMPQQSRKKSDQVANKESDRGASRKKRSIRQSWTAEEKQAIHRHFKEELRSRQLPGKEKIMKYCKMDADLKGRTKRWTTVKDFIRNQIRKTNPLDF